MPELPEVETTRRGLLPHIKGQTIKQVEIRQRQLRWPIPVGLETTLSGQTVRDLSRRGKYLLLATDAGTALIHLGMSGSLRLTAPDAAWKKHDHVGITLSNKQCLRFHDPRRFGVWLWTTDLPLEHELLCRLGPEPLGNDFSADYLYEKANNRRTAIKNFIMDSHIVVGVGNIYASEALFMAGISPTRAAGRIALVRYEDLVEAIRQVLSDAIKQGGTTLRDFVNSDGEPGYFRQSLRVYDREGQPCRECGSPIRVKRLGQRSTYYCGYCQR